jgi:hypothetical protein
MSYKINKIYYFRMIFFLATLTTATIFITDRTDGIWDRTLVAGITKTELLMAHIVCSHTLCIALPHFLRNAFFLFRLLKL